MPRKKGQTVGGRHLYQGRDPITGRRLNVRAATLSELESRMARVNRVRDGLRYGDISVHEAAAELRPAVGMSNRVGDLWERYARGLAPGSARTAATTWKNQLAPWFAEALVWDLSETRMRMWLTDLRRAPRPNGGRGYAPKTIRLAWDLLNAAVALAVRDGVLSGVPWGTEFSVPNPKAPLREREALRDPAELVALLTAARAWDFEHGRDYEGRFPVIAILALTGLRQAEACGLAWEDIDLDREPHFIHVRHQARRGWDRQGATRPLQPPKGREARTHVLHPNVVSALVYQRRELRARGRYRENGPVFPAAGGGEWRRSGEVMRPAALREIVEKAGLPNVSAWTVHSLRHSFARLELVGHGGDLRTVAERTGHKDLSQLEGYLRKAARDSGGSKIPELPFSLGPPALEAHAEGAEQPSRMLARADLNALSVLDDPGPERMAREETWPELARKWLAGIRHGERRRPRQVTAAIRNNVAKAYSKALTETLSREEARKAAARARRASLGAWARALSLAEKLGRESD